VLELFCASGVTTIASNLGLARTSLLAKLTAIFLSGWGYTNAGQVCALSSLLASHHSSFQFLEFSPGISPTAEQSQYHHD
jgi:hypothetical protein